MRSDWKGERTRNVMCGDRRESRSGGKEKEGLERDLEKNAKRMYCEGRVWAYS